MKSWCTTPQDAPASLQHPSHRHHHPSPPDSARPQLTPLHVTTRRHHRGGGERRNRRHPVNGRQRPDGTVPSAHEPNDDNIGAWRPPPRQLSPPTATGGTTLRKPTLAHTSASPNLATEKLGRGEMATHTRGRRRWRTAVHVVCACTHDHRRERANKTRRRVRHGVPADPSQGKPRARRRRTAAGRADVPRRGGCRERGDGNGAVGKTSGKRRRRGEPS